MPKRTDIRSILLIGSGPIVIGQACEFDYSGTQACKALREEGFRVILVNSNPATIMTDPEFADRTYIEPMTVEVLERIIAVEKPDALLPTIGGQTGLNLALDLAAAGVLARHKVELIGASVDAIRRAEDRDLFKTTMASIGLDLPRSGYARSLAEAEAIRRDLGLPLIIRPSRTLGGTGGSFATNDEEFRTNVAWGLEASPVHEILVEESIAGWKEFELEVMRDGRDNVVIVCSIENFDPMGVHTGDSITVAPAQTLTDKEYQIMRDAAVACIRAIGVDTGGSNIQFAVHPQTGRLVVIEMNPRVSRSSALASKATGFPIAKIAAKLAVGYGLDEIPNDITRETPACFEPTIDYVVTKIPRFTFEKFPQATDVLGPQMKSVGEAMAIGRTFKESLQKAMRSLEIGSHGFEPREGDVRERLRVPNADRLWYLGEAFRRGMTVAEVAALTAIDPWFLRHIDEIIAEERTLAATKALASERRRAPGRARRHDGGRRARAARGRGPRARLQDRRHLRRRVRGAHALPLLDLRAGRRRVEAGTGQEEDRHPGRRAEPDRAGDRVRLLLRPCRPGAAGGRLRDHHGQLQPRDREHRLRHLGQALLRAAHARGHARAHPPRRAGRRDRAVRRPDAAPARRAARARRRADHRHRARLDRPRRGPRALRGGAGQARSPAPAERRGALGRGGGAGGRRDRLPDPRAPVLRARRPRHGDRLRWREPRPLHARRGAGLARAPGAHRPVPRGRGRGGCGRGQRRRAGRDRRHHGAHRARRRAFGRERLLAPAVLARRRGAGGDPPPDGGARPRARRGRAHERAVRRQSARRLRARGEPARQPHRAVRQQGDRRAARQGGRALHGRPLARRAGLHPGDRARARERQGGGLPVHQVPGRRYRARAGDEVDRRGDGDRRQLRRGLREGADRGVDGPPRRRARL